jgi:hypothetical protein
MDRLRPHLRARLQTGSEPVPSPTRRTLRRAERRVLRALYGRGREEEQWLRQTMYRHLDEFFRSLPPERHDALEISGGFYADYAWRHYEAWHYPDFDVCAPPAGSARFDVVICDQVLEHVVDPFAAARSLAALAVPDGYVVVGVPFLVRVHPAPSDYWRFTADGLRVLLERAGLDVLTARAWGNRHCVNANFRVWAKKPWWASDANDPDLPVNVWAIAQKRAAA